MGPGTMKLPLLPLLLLVASVYSDSCCDHDQSGCFHVRCEADCSYSPCQDRPCDMDSLGQLWCADSNGKRINEMRVGSCEVWYSGYLSCTLTSSVKGQTVGVWTNTQGRSWTPQTVSRPWAGWAPVGSGL